MFRLALLVLAFAAPTVSPASDALCSPKGEDICQPTASFAALLQENMAGVRNGESEMVVQSVSAESGVIQLDIVFDHTEKEWQAIVAHEKINHESFVDQYRQMIRIMACKPPVAGMIAYGAAYRTIYRYSDGGVILDETVNSCK